MQEAVDSASDQSLDVEEENRLCPDTVVRNPSYTKKPSAVPCTETNCHSFQEPSKGYRQESKTLDQESRTPIGNPLNPAWARTRKYCQRELRVPAESHQLMSDWSRCEYCGGRADRAGTDGPVCDVCDQLGVELDQLLRDTATKGNITKQGETLWQDA